MTLKKLLEDPNVGTLRDYFGNPIRTGDIVIAPNGNQLANYKVGYISGGKVNLQTLDGQKPGYHMRRQVTKSCTLINLSSILPAE